MDAMFDGAVLTRGTTEHQDANDESLYFAVLKAANSLSSTNAFMTNFGTISSGISRSRFTGGSASISAAILRSLAAITVRVIPASPERTRDRVYFEAWITA